MAELCTNLPAFLTVNELADLLRVDRKLIYSLFHEGKIPGGKRLGRIIRFNKGKILKWMEEES